MANGIVYLYPPTSPTTHGPAVEYKGATHIERREVPAPAIEFVNDNGKRIISTLPYTVVFD